MTINCRGKIMDLSTPKVMGILNLTPDSFYDGGKLLSENAMLQHVEKMLKDGANIIDIGGMSSRPGVEIISEEVELNRVLPAVHLILKQFPEAIISVDTIRASVASRTLQAGVDIINDISGGRFDKLMLPTVAKYKAPFIIMHMQGMPDRMQDNPVYENVVSEVYDFFTERIRACKKAGIMDIILDPGFGFGKTVEHNYSMLRNLQYFTHLHLPIMTGASRKSMICKVLNVNPEKALNGTTAVNTLSLVNGANILRVHDVKEAKEVVKIWQAYQLIND